MYVSKRKNEHFTPFSMVFLPLIILLTNIFAIGEGLLIFVKFSAPKKMRLQPTGWTPTTVKK